ncbi:aminoglycoside phosphotransferase (APT) family kinase protein [Stella humosa]|uniref:Aminoglycoside phosphotransferase (APT) family kinase protein n=1 Tax=Stella humosa TaxID=94 RepID=A0A3N1MC30_9PROT|nr:phosphotransferase [Stella humosa]ROQ00267.1 aminoglycoside phosphotransferase (APT) family kinase protein [Stella humosa]BBK30495.1 hypothetical protein STHU_11290 [Stella humosa]
MLLFGGTDIVRIPHHPLVASRFELARRAVAILRDRLPVAIPEPRAHAGPPALETYPLLPGRAPRPADAGPALVSDLVGFLVALHGTPPALLAQGGIVPGFWADFLDHAARLSADRVPDAGVLAMIRRDVAVARDTDGALPATPVHYDLHPGNMLVAGDPARLAGVIDFADLSIDDPHWDFRHLGDLGPEFLSAVIDGYEAATGRSLSRARIGRLANCRRGLDHAKRALLDRLGSGATSGCTVPPATPS